MDNNIYKSDPLTIVIYLKGALCCYGMSYLVINIGMIFVEKIKGNIILYSPYYCSAFFKCGETFAPSGCRKSFQWPSEVNGNHMDKPSHFLLRRPYRYHSEYSGLGMGRVGLTCPFKSLMGPTQARYLGRDEYSSS